MNITALKIIGVFVLVLINAFFVLAEFAIVKVRDTRMAELAAAGSRRARVADHIVNHLDAYLSATQLGRHGGQPGPGLAGRRRLHGSVRPGHEPHGGGHRRFRLQ